MQDTVDYPLRFLPSWARIELGSRLDAISPIGLDYRVFGEKLLEESPNRIAAFGNGLYGSPTCGIIEAAANKGYCLSKLVAVFNEMGFDGYDVLLKAEPEIERNYLNSSPEQFNAHQGIEDCDRLSQCNCNECRRIISHQRTLHQNPNITRPRYNTSMITERCELQHNSSCQHSRFRCACSGITGVSIMSTRAGNTPHYIRHPVQETNNHSTTIHQYPLNNMATDSRGAAILCEPEDIHTAYLSDGATDLYPDPVRRNLEYLERPLNIKNVFSNNARVRGGSMRQQPPNSASCNVVPRELAECMNRPRNSNPSYGNQNPKPQTVLYTKTESERERTADSTHLTPNQLHKQHFLTKSNTNFSGSSSCHGPSPEQLTHINITRMQKTNLPNNVHDKQRYAINTVYEPGICDEDLCINNSSRCYPSASAHETTQLGICHDPVHHRSINNANKIFEKENNIHLAKYYSTNLPLSGRNNSNNPKSTSGRNHTDRQKNRKLQREICIQNGNKHGENNSYLQCKNVTNIMGQNGGSDYDRDETYLKTPISIETKPKQVYSDEDFHVEQCQNDRQTVNNNIYVEDSESFSGNAVCNYKEANCLNISPKCCLQNSRGILQESVMVDQPFVHIFTTGSEPAYITFDRSDHPHVIKLLQVLENNNIPYSCANVFISGYQQDVMEWSERQMEEASVIVMCLSPNYKASAVNLEEGVTSQYNKLNHTVYKTLRHQFISRGYKNKNVFPVLLTEAGAKKEDKPMWLDNTFVYEYPQNTGVLVEHVRDTLGNG